MLCAGNTSLITNRVREFYLVFYYTGREYFKRLLLSNPFRFCLYFDALNFCAYFFLFAFENDVS